MGALKPDPEEVDQTRPFLFWSFFKYVNFGKTQCKILDFFLEFFLIEKTLESEIKKKKVWIKLISCTTGVIFSPSRGGDEPKSALFPPLGEGPGGEIDTFFPP